MFDFQVTDLATIKTPWLVLPIFKEEIPPVVQSLDAKIGGLLTQLRANGDITGKANECTPIFSPTGIPAQRLLVLGLGEKNKLGPRAVRQAFSAASKWLSSKKLDQVHVVAPEFSAETLDNCVRSMLIGFHQGCIGPGIRKAEPDRYLPTKVTFVGLDLIGNAQKLAQAEAISSCIALARELVNLPPCELYPETFAQRAESAAKDCGVECIIWDQEKLVQERMNSLLGVAQGSDKPPRLVILKVQNNPGGKTLGLVGKGVTFDSGGLSLKPSDGMLDMKCDMAGAATALAATIAIAKLKAPVNVITVLALVENMPSGKAFKLGDVLKARNGKTIEIHNTDAEGRLILADALSYAVEQKVDHLVDLATLTGACLVALGTEISGLMSNNEAWSQQVQQAADKCGELVWPLPMHAHFGELIKSSVADMKNTGGTRWGGAITAAKLLEEFVGDTPWVHLDIAGPAFADSDNNYRSAGGTGVHVETLVELANSYGK